MRGLPARPGRRPVTDDPPLPAPAASGASPRACPAGHTPKASPAKNQNTLWNVKSWTSIDAPQQTRIITSPALQSRTAGSRRRRTAPDRRWPKAATPANRPVSPISAINQMGAEWKTTRGSGPESWLCT